MTTTRTIPLQSVRDALMMAALRCKVRPALSRYAAYSAIWPLSAVTCRSSATTKARRSNIAPAAHTYGMDRGDIGAVITRTRFEHGLPEVRRTWGEGLRALQAECARGLLP